MFMDVSVCLSMRSELHVSTQTHRCTRVIDMHAHTARQKDRWTDRRTDADHIKLILVANREVQFSYRHVASSWQDIVLDIAQASAGLTNTEKSETSVADRAERSDCTLSVSVLCRNSL